MGKAQQALYPPGFLLAGCAGLSVVQLGQIPARYKGNERSSPKQTRRPAHLPSQQVSCHSKERNEPGLTWFVLQKSTPGIFIALPFGGPEPNCLILFS